jgi:GT2 family glycosyltransferase/glycosyltransferase involved in cell wall biosynthesis
MSKYLALASLAFQHYKTNGIKSLLKVTAQKLKHSIFSKKSVYPGSLEFRFLLSIWNLEPEQYEDDIQRKFTVIIPVFNGFEHIVKLRESMGKREYDLLIVDDCSTDKKVIGFLLDWSDEAGVKLIRNESNLGYTRSVNLGIRAIKSDFILLNSDTQVSGDWTKRLLHCLHNNPRTAAVSPFSNSATIFSWPSNHENPVSKYYAEINAAASRIQISDNLTAPTINGFCVAIKYEAWEEVGEFDEVTFGVGYGEENDWSIRARKLGFEVLLAPNVYVSHFHGGSFDAGVKKSRLSQSWTDLNKKYPNYKKDVVQHLKNDPWARIRQSLEVSVALKPKQETVIYISHGRGGGADVWLYQEIKSNLKNNKTCVVVLPGSGDFVNATIHHFLENQEREVVVTNIPRSEFNSLFSLVEVVEIVVSNLVNWQDPFSFIERIKTMAPLTFVMHDFYSICPSYNLLDYNKTFCAVPEDLNVCNGCLKNNSLILEELRSENIIDWRSNFRTLFEDSGTKIKFFSRDSLKWTSKAFDMNLVNYEIDKPNYVNFNVMKSTKVTSKNNKTWRIAFIGQLSLAKGAELAAAIVESSLAEFPRLEFHMIGEFIGKRPETRNIEFHGAYDRSNLTSRISKLQIDIVIIPSIWPETYNIVTDEVVSSGTKVIVSPLGAMQERFNRNPLVYVSSELSTEGFLKAINMIVKS